MKARLLSLSALAALVVACSAPAGDDASTDTEALERHDGHDVVWPMPSTTGPNDGLARLACSLSSAPADHYHLASRPEDAPTIVLVPSRTKRYHLHRPSASAVGYAKVQTPDWHMTVSIGAPAGVAPSIDGTELVLQTAKNGACSAATTDTRFLVHEWGSYLIRFGATGPDAFYTTIVASTGG